jgi:hypothetical protein
MLQRIAGNVSPQTFLFPTFSISLCTWTVQSGFVPHVTFLVQKLLGEMEKCGKGKTSGRHVSCNLPEQADMTFFVPIRYCQNRGRKPGRNFFPLHFLKNAEEPTSINKDEDDQRKRANPTHESYIFT